MMAGAGDDVLYDDPPMRRCPPTSSCPQVRAAARYRLVR